MSTKNSWAWRVPIANLNRFTEQFKTEAERQLKDSIKYWLRKIWTHKKTTGFSEAWNNAEKFTTEYRQIFYKVNPGFQFWIKGEFVYIIPYGIKEMFKIDGADDWGYQDQVDEPDHLPDNWEQRGNDWNELMNYPSYDYSFCDDTYFVSTVLNCAHELRLWIDHFNGNA